LGHLGAVRPGADAPDTVQDKLARTGFIQIDSSGLFTPSRYATPDQIAHIANGAILLNVHAAQLLSAE